jgi:hypothetical protein
MIMTKPDQETLVQEQAAKQTAEDNEKLEAAVYAGQCFTPIDLLRKIKSRTPPDVKAMIEQHLKWYEMQEKADTTGTQELPQSPLPHETL